MSTRYLAVGLFLITGLSLFTLGLFFLGDSHEAFSRHVLLYTELRDVDGLMKGSKVRVGGMDAGEILGIEVPNSPQSPFRIEMRINERLHSLVRQDSLVTVDTEGVVGETFLSIHPGDAASDIAKANTTLRSTPPIVMADLLSHGLGLMNDADLTLKQVGGKLNQALDGVNGAVGNANDILVGLKQGRGPAGILLRDERMAGQIRESMANVESTTSNLRMASSRADSLIGEFQEKRLPDTLNGAATQMRAASTQINSTVQQVQLSLSQALGPDSYGVPAGKNISQALSNVNAATANMAEDTEALKHNFFFRGFFNRRGYYNLSSISPQEYRRSKLFSSRKDQRTWLAADVLFQNSPNGDQELTQMGKRLIDETIVKGGDQVFGHPVVIEGYSNEATSADQLASSYKRALLVRTYLIARFPFAANHVGTIPLSATPPPGLVHDRWSGVCILIADKK